MIKLSQQIYFKKIFYKFFLDPANPSNTSIKESIQLLLNNSKTQAIDSKQEKYQDLTGLLIFLIVKTRPNITFTMLIVSRFAKNLSYFHTKAVKTIFKYLIRNKNRGIGYGQNILKIKRNLDSDWASNKNSKKSTSSYIFIVLNGGSIS